MPLFINNNIRITVVDIRIKNIIKIFYNLDLILQNRYHFNYYYYLSKKVFLKQKYCNLAKQSL